MIDPNVSRQRLLIMQSLSTRGSYQLRHYSEVPKDGKTYVYGSSAYKALHELKKDKKLHIIRRRRFHKVFEDGLTVSGVSITAIPIWD